MKEKTILPDLLAPGLKLVFCGTAAGHVSAARGCYYAHPHNKFWPTLYEVGLTPRLFAPSEFHALLTLGIGLTDIAKTTSGMDKELPQGSLGTLACAALRARIEEVAPRHLAFTSLTAGRKIMGAKASLGIQPKSIGRTQIWILPSSSPAAQWNWTLEPWHDLAAAVRSI